MAVFLSKKNAVDTFLREGAQNPVSATSNHKQMYLFNRLLKFVFEAANIRQIQALFSVTYRRSSPRGAYYWYA